MAKSPGAPSKLNADHRRALAEVVEAGPVPAVDGVVRLDVVRKLTALASGEASASVDPAETALRRRIEIELGPDYSRGRF